MELNDSAPACRSPPLPHDEAPAVPDNDRQGWSHDAHDHVLEKLATDARLATDAKLAEIAAASETGDVAALVQLATSAGGLLTDGLRRKAWPILLGCYGPRGSVTAEPSATASCDWRDLPKHKDEGQVQLDVDRSFIYYPDNESEAELDARKIDLYNVIVETLRRHPMLCYFQGFHDIVQVFLLVLGETSAVDAVARLSLLRIRDFMLPSMSPSLAHLQLLPAILYAVDPSLCAHLSQTQPYFALAATLTLYAHEIEEYGEISRLFDFLLAKESAVSVYLFAATILSRRKELLRIPADEPDMLHFTLSKLPQPLQLDSLIQRTVELFGNYPPETLPFRAWNKISPYSVLKTTKSERVDSVGGSAQGKPPHTIEDGEAFFAHQVAQLRRQELRERIEALALVHRRTIGTIVLAVLVGGLSFWLQRRSPGPQLAVLSGLWNKFNIFSTPA